MTLLALAAPPGVALAAADGRSAFAPIPVFSIYPPVTPGGGADEQMLSGRMVAGSYPMARPASRPWRIAFLFPHLKDPYWAGCAYGVMSEAKRLGVAVDILPANGYDDLIGQLRITDAAIAAKYDAIVVSPISLTGNNAFIAKVRAAGIPVFELANDSTSDDLTTKVTTSMKDMGRYATRWVIEDAQRRGYTSIRIALLPGPTIALLSSPTAASGAWATIILANWALAPHPG